MIASQIACRAADAKQIMRRYPLCLRASIIGHDWRRQHWFGGKLIF